MEKDKFGIAGYIKVYITRENGFKELVFEDKNAIQASYANAVVDALDSGLNYAIETPFISNGNPPTDGKDGIAVKDSGGLWYGLIMSTNVRSTGELTLSGTFTGVAITVADANSVLFGHNWLTSTFVNLFAKPSSWVSQAVLVTETLTIDWTIKHSAS